MPQQCGDIPYCNAKTVAARNKIFYIGLFITVFFFRFRGCFDCGGLVGQHHDTEVGRVAITIGLVIVFVVLFMPGGVLGLAQSKFKTFGARRLMAETQESMDTET